MKHISEFLKKYKDITKPEERKENVAIGKSITRKGKALSKKLHVKHGGSHLGKLLEKSEYKKANKIN